MIDIPEGFKELDPIVIISPTVRSGTTLLQRLLCSAPNTLIYGESVVNELNIFLNFYLSKALYLRQSKAYYDHHIEKVLSGDCNSWIPDLMPDVDQYLNSMAEACTTSTRFCKEFALKNNRPIWGMKVAGPQLQFAQMMQNWLPNAKFIFALRNLEDCLRSAKAMEMVINEQETRAFCESWVAGRNHAMTLTDLRNVLIWNYEELIACSEEQLSRLEEFTGSKGINRDVMKVKVNTVEENNESGAGRTYIPPVELTDADRKIIKQALAQMQQVQ